MAPRKAFRRIDLIEMRRQLVHARNRHGDDLTLVRRINKLLCRIYHLDAARDRDQDARIRKALRIVLRPTGSLDPRKRAAEQALFSRYRAASRIVHP